MKPIQTKYYKYLIIIIFFIVLIIFLSTIIFIKQKNKSTTNTKLSPQLPKIEKTAQTKIIEHYLGLQPNLENLKTEFKKINPNWNQEIFAYNYHLFSKSDPKQKISDAQKQKIFAIFLNFNSEKIKSYQNTQNLLDKLNKIPNAQMHIFWKKEKPNQTLILTLKDELLNNINKWQQMATNCLDKLQIYMNDIDKALENPINPLEKDKIATNMDASKISIIETKDFIQKKLMHNLNLEFTSVSEQNIYIQQLRKKSLDLIELKQKLQTLKMIIQKNAQNKHISPTFKQDMQELESIIQTIILEITNQSDKLNI
jgi:hypothetical protein